VTRVSDSPKPREFDPYHEWLGIPPGPRPPSPEVLLGVPAGETDEKRILAAAMERKERLDWMMLGEDGHLATELAREVAGALSLLLERARVVEGEPVAIEEADEVSAQPGAAVPQGGSEPLEASSLLGASPSAEGRTIRFICSNCISPVEAPRRQAGSQMRCPWCQTVLTVPQRSREEVHVETYAVADGSKTETARPAEAEVRFRCLVCRTEMSAPVSQAGRKVVCPDCGTRAVVPARAPQEPSPSSPVVPPAAGDVYNVLEGQDQPLPTDKEVYQRYIPVVCSLCQTRMLATEEQVGEVMVCPDCGTGNVVPPPSETLRASAPEAMEGYRLAGSSQPSAAAGKAAEYTVTCPLCHTRLQAPRSKAGKRALCPDCRRPFRVPPPPEDGPRLDPFEEPVEVYELAASPKETPDRDAVPPPALHDVAQPPSAVPAEPRTTGLEVQAQPGAAVPQVGSEQAVSEASSQARRRRKEDEEPLLPRSPRPALSSWPLVRGVFLFPFYPESLVAWVRFTLGNLVAWAVAVATVPLAVLSRWWMAVFGLVYFFWASKYCLTIVAQTANGAERIEEWFTEDPAERWFESLYLINSLILGSLIGLCVEGLTRTLAAGLGAGAGLFFSFPVILLSMLETGSVLNPISPAVLGSLVRRCWAWLAFYVLAALLMAASVGLEYGLHALGGPWAALPGTILTATAIMVYFRLLGRLGWYITELSRGG